MIKNNLLYCDWCKQEIQQLTKQEALEDNFPGHGWNDYQTAALHLCFTCHQEYFDERYCEGSCETRPCERGRECWVNDSSSVPYETYFAERVTGEPVFERFMSRQATRQAGPAAQAGEKYHQLMLF
jgi:hypothetical protein